MPKMSIVCYFLKTASNVSRQIGKRSPFDGLSLNICLEFLFKRGYYQLKLQVEKVTQSMFVCMYIAKLLANKVMNILRIRVKFTYLGLVQWHVFTHEGLVTS